MSTPVMAAAINASPETKKTGAFPDWVLLDRIGRTYCYDDKDAAAATVEDDATAVPVHTTNNQSGYFTFNLRPPPSVSYLDLHWPYGIPESILDLPAIPTIVSADGPLVLLSIDIQNVRYIYSAPDMFVYTAGISSPPLLRRLPACTVKPQGLVGRSVFLMMETDVGILCRGGEPDDYVVADLLVSWKAGGDPCGINPSPLFAMLCLFSSKTGVWMTKEMLAPQPQGEGQFPFLWYCDRVLPFAGRFLCWVDYYNGILLGDLSKDNTPVLCYIPFPGKRYPDEVQLDRGIPEYFRRVCVSQDKIHFIHIGSDWQETGSPCGNNDETITIWTLNTTDQNFNWEIQYVINLNVLWTDDGYQAQGLPHHRPEYPVMAKNDPRVLYCLLKEDRFSRIGNVWIIKLDMHNSSFGSCIKYINEQIVCCFDNIDMSQFQYFSDVPFLPSDFSKHLNKQPGQQGDVDRHVLHPSKRSKLALYDWQSE